jgi:hypothetical protein
MLGENHGRALRRKIFPPLYLYPVDDPENQETQVAEKGIEKVAASQEQFILPMAYFFDPASNYHTEMQESIKSDGFVKSILERHPGESLGPERPEIAGFRLSPE